MNLVIRLIITIAVLATLTVLGLRFYFGGGTPYTDLTSSPQIGEPGLETVLSYPEPIGGLAISERGRVFFAVHAASRSKGPRVFEWRNGEAQPFPDARTQAAVFDTPARLAIDQADRLWVIDPATHGFGRPRIIAVDLRTGLIVHEHVFPREVAPRGSYLSDIQLSPSGNRAFIADTSLWRRSPAVVVYDTVTRVSQRRLETHGALRAQNWLIGTPVRDMRYIANLVPYKPGLHGLALDPTGRWLHLGAMTHGTLYRVPTAALLEQTLSEEELASRVEALGSKPLSSGILADLAGNTYVTDVEHGAVVRINAAGKLDTLVRSPRIRWAESLVQGPGGWLYVSDSALAETLFKPRRQVLDRGPYHVYRFKPGSPSSQNL